jgi:hypothetical protein
MKTRDINRPPQKKAYEVPVLVTYGTVWELTRNVGQTGNLDGAPPLRVATHT